MANPRDEVTRLLSAIGRGEAGADEELMAHLYRELRVLAAGTLGPRGDPTLQPTALVHEAYLRLLEREGASFDNRRNFFFAAARAMRDILVERARRRAAEKRGGAYERRELDQDLLAAAGGPEVDVLALEEALAELGAEDARKLELVQLRFYAGLSAEETAELLGVSLRTLEREWRFVRAWLHKRLGEA
jgi:RNA polymerase sigma factor (TIGR02999 family)